MTRTTGRTSRTARTMALSSLAAALLVGCGSSPSHSPTASRSPSSPASVRDADPCSLVPRSVVTADGLRQQPASSDAAAATERRCLWSATSLAVIVDVNWSTDVLIEFSQDYPTAFGEATLDGQGVIVGQNPQQKQCAVLLFAASGTMVEVGVGEDATAEPDAVCAQAKSIGTAVIRELRSRRLLTLPTSASPQPTVS